MTNSVASGGEPAVVASALRKTFPNGVVALEGIDLRIERASVTAVLGENGSGKSTLLELVAGLSRPSSGEIAVLGERAQSSASFRRRIGHASQALALDPEMTGAETLALFATLYGVATRTHETDELVRGFELTQFIARRVGTYSGGMRQRLHLALALLHRPELLLLDEPTSALDPGGRAWFWERLASERSLGRTIVVVTHDLIEAAEHADRIVLLHEGRLLASGAPESVVFEHASFRVDLELAEGETVPEDLGTLPGVESVTLQHGRAVVDLGRIEQGTALEIKDRILGFLVERRLHAVGFQLRAPDLASAYFSLTGRPPKAAPRAQRRGSAERRERMAAS